MSFLEKSKVAASFVTTKFVEIREAQKKAAAEAAVKYKADQEIYRNTKKKAYPFCTGTYNMLRRLNGTDGRYTRVFDKLL